MLGKYVPSIPYFSFDRFGSGDCEVIGTGLPVSVGSIVLMYGWLVACR